MRKILKMVNYARLGYQNEKNWQDHLNRVYVWVWKIPDARAMKGFNMPQAPSVPCDFIAVTKAGRTDYYECKQTSKQSLPFRNIKEHQVEELAGLCELGVRAYFAINFNNRERGKSRKNDTYLVTALDLKNAIENYTGERKSIPKKWFEENGVHYQWLKREGEYGWY